MKFDKEHFDNLMSEFHIQRDKLNEMIDVLDECDTPLKSMALSTDHRYRGALEEKFKALAEMYKVKLAIRKEISQNIKDEIELKRKIELEDEDGNSLVLTQSELLRSVEEVEKVIKLNSTTKKKIDNGINLVEIKRTE